MYLFILLTKLSFVHASSNNDTCAIFLMKVYTCASESALAEHIAISTPKYKFYRAAEVPSQMFEEIKRKLLILREKVILDTWILICFFIKI